MDLTNIEPEEEGELTKEQKIQSEIDAVIAQMESLKVEDDSQYKYAADWLKRNKETQKIVEKEFNDELEAAKEKKKAAEAERKAVVQKIEQFNEPLKKAEKETRRLIEEYVNEKERQRREAERKRLEEQRQQQEAEGEQQAEPEPAPEPEPEPPKTEGVTFYETWQYEIEDPTQIPREYLQVDEKKIRQYVQAMKGDAEIPGVKIWKEKKSRVQG